MPTKAELEGGFRLGDWEVLPNDGVIRGTKGESRPEPQTWRVLMALAIADGKLVSKEDLIRDVWGGRAVSDDPINRAIREVRKCLGDSAQDSQYVETQHKRGYRLLKPVELSQEKFSKIPLKGVATVLVIAAAAIAASNFITDTPPVRSIAVLPLDNLSSRPEDDYLVAGFRDELVQTLHGIDDFTVIAVRKSYDMEPCETAEELAVESVLLGSLQRIGDDLKIHYTISSCEHGVAHSGNIEGPVGRLFELQEELATMVRDSLIGKSAPMLIKSRPSNSRAYDSYMRGMFELEHRGRERHLEEAIELLKSAITQDPNYGPSYLALATAYALSVDYRRAPLREMHLLAKQTVEQGIAVDPIIEAAAAAIYGYDYHKEKRWAESEKAYLMAVEADVVDSNAFNWYSRMLASVGRLEDALEIAKRGVRIEPSSGLLSSRLAIVYAWLGDSENAYEYLQRSNDLGWTGERDLMAYALLLAREGRFEEAREVTSAGFERFGVSDAWAEPFFAAMTDPSMTGEALLALDSAVEEQQVGRFIEIVARSFLGDIDGAMNVARMLEEPGEAFEMDILFIPELEAVRQHPDFIPLLDRLGVTGYWKQAGCSWNGDRVICPPT